MTGPQGSSSSTAETVYETGPRKIPPHDLTGQNSVWGKNEAQCHVLPWKSWNRQMASFGEGNYHLLAAGLLVTVD